MRPEDALDRFEPELMLDGTDVCDDHFRLRSSSTSAENALPVLRIASLRIGSAFQRRRRVSSSCSLLVAPGRSTAWTPALHPAVHGIGQDARELVQTPERCLRRAASCRSSHTG